MVGNISIIATVFLLKSLTANNGQAFAIGISVCGIVQALWVMIPAYKKGYKIYLIFVIQREDCDRFQIAKDIDPKYYEMLKKAVKKNLKILCYDCKFSLKGIKLNRFIKFKI